MPSYETYSKRQQRIAREGTTPIYRYDILPEMFRNQVIHILSSAIGRYYEAALYDFNASSPSNSVWHDIFQTITEEFGRFQLGTGTGTVRNQIFTHIQAAPVSEVLDVIELCFQRIGTTIRKQTSQWKFDSSISVKADDAIDTLNRRFREHALGYQFIGSRLVREDSQYIYAEIIEPTVSLLFQPGFAGPNAEYLNAHEHYRHGRYSEAIVESAKAFESTLKTICVLRKWDIDPNLTAKQILKVLFDRGLIPPELRTHFGNLQGVIESGAPAIRNKAGRGHGSGPAPIAVPSYLAAYVLHTIAADILLMVNAHFDKPKN